DESLNVLHAYVQLFMMRQGRLRAILAILAERLVFRDLVGTLVLYFKDVLSEPDPSLTSYQALSPDDMAAFVADFDEDPRGTIERYFGAPDIERRPEFADIADMRLSSLEADVDPEDDLQEVDSTVAEALGAHDEPPALEADTDAQAPNPAGVADYLIEYTREHLSPVIARALRVYRSRGLAAAAAELKVTKAPRKTLSALAKLARVRYSGVAIILDGFDNWAGVPAETRIKIAGTLFELQMLLAPDAFFVFAGEQGLASEIDNVFGSAQCVEWEFPNLVEIEQDPDCLTSEIVDRWCSAAAMAGSLTLSAIDPVLAQLMVEAEGSLTGFVRMAAAAVEDAAVRASTALDEHSLAVGLAASEGR
ncbi:MAG: hypothetical protein L6413_00270, partial [Coriobacteriia bacterium]|nr:hypothetical protein [Coriobacteriia bacterium]